jgi:hypothetical protein
MKRKDKVSNERKGIVEHIKELEEDPSRNYLVADDQERYIREIEAADEQRLTELSLLFESIDNVYFQALHHYANWRLRNKKSRYKEAKEAARLFEDGADLALQNEYDFLLHQNLEMALSVMKSLKYNDEIERLVTKTIRNLELLHRKKKHRWSIEQVRLFLVYGDPKEKEKVEVVANLTCQIIDEVYGDTNLHCLLDNYTELAVNLSKIQKDEKTRENLISRLAENYLRYARNEKSAITRQDAYKRALKLYKRINAEDAIGKIKVEMAMLRDDLHSEMKPLLIEIFSRREIIDSFLKAAEQTEKQDIPGLFGAWSLFVPEKEKMITAVRKIPSLAGVLMPTVIFNEGNPIAELKTPEDRLEFDIHRSYQMQIIKKTFDMRQIMKELIEKGMFSEYDVIHFFLSNTDVFSDRSLKFIEDGVKRYFADDFVGAIHVLIPQIEATLRLMMQKLHIPTTVQDRNGIREGDLSSYLRNAPVRQRILGEDFAIWLRVFLTEKVGGLNIRNNLAHGLIKFDQLTPEIASGVLFALLRLGSLRIIEKQETCTQEGKTEDPQQE